MWLAAQTYLLCLASFIVGVVVTALVLRRRKPVPEVPQELLEIPEEITDEADGEDFGDEDFEDEEEEAVVEATGKSQ